MGDKETLDCPTFSSRPIERVIVLRAFGGHAIIDERFGAALTEQVDKARPEGYSRINVDIDCPFNEAGLRECFIQEKRVREAGGRMAFFSSHGYFAGMERMIKS